MKKMVMLTLALGAAVSLSACTTTEQYTTTGAVLGAGTGALIGDTKGAVIGGLVGGVAGNVMGQQKERSEYYEDQYGY